MRKVLLVVFIVLWSTSASAGADVWSIGTNNLSTAEAWRTSEITPSTTGTTPVLDVGQCRSGFLDTNDNTVTFDIERCGSMAGACYAINLTSPINTAVNKGMQIDPLPSFIRINVVANAGATFQLACKR